MDRILVNIVPVIMLGEGDNDYFMLNYKYAIMTCSLVSIIQHGCCIIRCLIHAHAFVLTDYFIGKKIKQSSE